MEDASADIIIMPVSKKTYKIFADCIKGGPDMRRKHRRTTAIILAGGSGKRMGSRIPKQYIELGGKPLIWYAVNAFNESFVDRIVVVCAKGDEDRFREEILERYGFEKVIKVVEGGAERYDSVCQGLRAVPDDTEFVFIHDGARPFVTEEILKRALIGVEGYGACAVGVPPVDTVRIADSNSISVKTPDRNTLWMMQTPQVFRFPAILRAYEEMLARLEQLTADGIHITDDVQVWELMTPPSGEHLPSVKLVPGSRQNFKITTNEDLLLAEAILAENNKQKCITESRKAEKNIEMNC